VSQEKIRKDGEFTAVVTVGWRLLCLSMVVCADRHLLHKQSEQFQALQRLVTELQEGLNKQGKKIEEQGEKIEEQRKKIEEQGKKIVELERETQELRHRVRVLEVGIEFSFFSSFPLVGAQI
jgi:peptidoglycan hydrolase CwlO-like protein